MIITELYIKNFGKFHETRFLIQNKIHVFYGENEYGKSTIYAFIKAMLFGLERGRGKAASKDDFSRYEPWENPNYYAGYIRFRSGSRNFRLDRSFDRYNKSVSLICEDDGEELSVEQGDLDMLLGGMDLTAFENTVAVGQLSAPPGQELAAELKNYAANYYETGGVDVDLHGALNKLKMRKKEAVQEMNKLREKQLHKKADVEKECRFVEKEMARLQSEFDECESRYQVFRTGKEADLPVKPDEQQNGKSSSSLIKSGCVGIFAGFLGMAVGRLSVRLLPVGDTIIRIAGVIMLIGVVLLSAGVSIRLRRIYRHKKGNRQVTSKSEAEPQAASQLKWQMHRIQADWKEKQIYLENLHEQVYELGEPDENNHSLRRRIQALEMAEEKLIEASQQITRESGQMLNRNASEILNVITNGKYSRLFVDDQLNMSILRNGQKVAVERLSRGTIEQVYFALRMAAVEMLYEESIPVILDEAFALYDEQRLKSVLKWLREQQRQVIIFTCQKREAELLCH